MPALLARGGVTGAAADRALRRQHDRQPPSPPGGRSLPARRDSAPGNYGAHFERGLCWLLPGIDLPADRLDRRSECGRSPSCRSRRVDLRDQWDAEERATLSRPCPIRTTTTGARSRRPALEPATALFAAGRRVRAVLGTEPCSHTSRRTLATGTLGSQESGPVSWTRRATHRTSEMPC